METTTINKVERSSISLLLAVSIFIAACAYAFYDSFAWMYDSWMNYEEYSHGIMIPFVCAYLLWQRIPTLVYTVPTSNSLLAWCAVVVSMVLLLLMQLATVHFGVLLSFLLLLYAGAYMIVGAQNFKLLVAPLLLLLFMLPLPNFITNNLSSELQLLSSQLGVWFIRLFDISVYLEGNVIDLGSYKLQVVDACSGLRYLFPLVALGFILVYIARIPLWQKLVVFVSTIPITVVMNSFRIGGIGVSVEYWGPEMAEGLLHDVEGWFMFMASLAVVLCELKILLLMSANRPSLTDIFVLDRPEQSADSHRFLESFFAQSKRAGTKLVVLSVLVCGSALAIQSLVQGEAEPQDRLRFNHFPLFLGEWRGQPQTMEQVYIDELKFDDYTMMNYSKDSENVNFYVAYYGSQRSGQSAHSPRSCIPGGGWQIQSIDQFHLGDLYVQSQPLNVNRVLIQKDDNKQAVYYWFQQRGRIITNEYLVKWYLFWDALNINRTDGALVRLVVPLGKGRGFEEADDVAADFMTQAYFRLPSYIPGL